MKKLNYWIMWMVLAAIGLLAALSVLEAFYGAQKARVFFNSIPLRVYWYGLAVLLIAGFVEFPRLLGKPGLFMIHAGCLLVVCGGMWSSPAGHRVAKRFLNIDKTPSGFLVIYEGQSENNIITNDRERLVQLPFSIKLNDFRLEYYDAEENPIPRLYIRTKEGDNLQLLARTGEEIFFGPARGRLKVVRIFRNFKIGTENGETVVKDEPGGENPAVAVEIESPDGSSRMRYVFERFADYNHGEDKDGLQLNYASQGQRPIRDYFSDIVIIENGQEVLTKTIEVNYPLHYGGYHFYQHSYDTEEGKYTTLSVTSDSGLYVVYCGYWLLCLGILWQCWLRHVIRYIKNRK